MDIRPLSRKELSQSSLLLVQWIMPVICGLRLTGMLHLKFHLCMLQEFQFPVPMPKLVALGKVPAHLQVRSFPSCVNHVENFRLTLHAYIAAASVAGLSAYFLGLDSLTNLVATPALLKAYIQFLAYQRQNGLSAIYNGAPFGVAALPN